MLDEFSLLLAATVVLVISLVVLSARRTMVRVDSVRREGSEEEGGSEARAQGPFERLRAQEVPCVRCGGPTVAVLESGSRYRCELCTHEFESPPHADTDPAQD